MDRFLSLSMLSISIAVSILLVVLFVSNKTNTPNNKMLWLAVPARFLSVYALFTAWIWVYYINVFLSLPFFIVSILLNYLTWKRFKRNKWVKDTTIVQLLTVLLSMAVALWVWLVRF